jgi:MarR family transcriptional regulator, organic hydroperoxide resistance regulator
MESISEYGAAVDVDLVELFRDLIRFETELWDRVEARVQQAHGSPLAWLEIMQVVDVTADCRVLDIARALSITVGGASKVVDKVEAAGCADGNLTPPMVDRI